MQVGGALVQYAQPSASRTRPSCSRPTRGSKGARLGADVESRPPGSPLSERLAFVP